MGETFDDIKGKAKEAAGFVKEELNEHGKSPEAKERAQEGRDLRNEGRIEDGKAPKTTEPGTGARWTSHILVVRVWRGSMAMTRAPFARACSMKCHW